VYLLCFLVICAAGTTVAQQPVASSNHESYPEQSNHYEQGLTYYRSSEYRLAAKEFEQALQENPKNAWISYYLARTHLENKDQATATSLAQTLIDQHPTFSRGYFLLGYVYFKSQQWELGERALKKAIELEPNYSESHLILGSTYVLLKNLELAEREMIEAVELDPQNLETHYYLGRLYFTRNKFPVARGEFQKMLQLDPSSAKAYNNLGITEKATGHFEMAESDFKKAIDLSQTGKTPSEWPYVNLGELYYEQGRLGLSLEFLAQAVRINPQNDVGLFWLGKCQFTMGRLGQAKDLLEKAIAIYPPSPEYHYFLSKIYRKLGDLDAAKRCLRRFEELRGKP
jgi:tetratricopeptide (TPR) repeat protein